MMGTWGAKVGTMLDRPAEPRGGPLPPVYRQVHRTVPPRRDGLVRQPVRYSPTGDGGSLGGGGFPSSPFASLAHFAVKPRPDNALRPPNRPAGKRSALPPLPAPAGKPYGRGDTWRRPLATPQALRHPPWQKPCQRHGKKVINIKVCTWHGCKKCEIGHKNR